MIKVFYYYYYYLFYTKVLPDDQPRLTVVFTLSLSESFVLSTLINSIFIVLYCQSVSKWLMLSVFFAIFLVNYFYFASDRVNLIINEKPKIVNNLLSVVITLLFFIVSFSLMILSPLYLRTFLETNCLK